MEFLVLTSQYRRHLERGRKLMRTVVEVAETVRAERVVRRGGNIYSTGVYLKDGKETSLHRLRKRRGLGKNLLRSYGYYPVLLKPQPSPADLLESLGKRSEI